PPPQVAPPVERPTPAARPGGHKKRDSVYFGPGSSTLEARDFAVLDVLVERLNGPDAGRRVRLSGHSDNQKSAEINREVSKKRAEAVRDYLVKRGIDPARITLESFGDERPIGKNETEAGRSVNRRVDFLVLPGG
ncbi:MAG: OmpA family protein, partial [Bradymonadia bacterium]